MNSLFNILPSGTTFFISSLILVLIVIVCIVIYILFISLVVSVVCSIVSKYAVASAKEIMDYKVSIQEALKKQEKDKTNNDDDSYQNLE